MAAISSAVACRNSALRLLSEISRTNQTFVKAFGRGAVLSPATLFGLPKLRLPTRKDI
jgi:hypothetical protein